MSKTKLTQEDITSIISLYQTEIPSTHQLAERFKVGHRKISQILKEANVEIQSRGAKITIGNSSDIESATINRYKADLDKRLVAVCKKTGVEFEDANNLSGCLTKHILETYGDVPIPTNTYQRKKHELINGKKWFEEYFEIKEINTLTTRKCGLCDWVTTDVDNKSGCFENHILHDHSISLSYYLYKFPEDMCYHKTHDNKIKRYSLLLDKDNFIVCHLCNEKMKTITNTHLINAHNITCEDYKLMYPNEKLVSNTSGGIFKVNAMLANINMKPTWTSKAEIEIKEFIESLGFDVDKSRNRGLLQGKEVDLVIPKVNVAIEYNGLYYHTERMGKHSTYHLDKTLACNAAGYNLIHIFEDEWVVNKDLVKNKLKHILNVNQGIKIGGRNVNLKQLSPDEKSEFLKQNHIQGNDNSRIAYGAFYKDELVGVMTFNDKRNMTKTNDGEYELTRYATKQNYIVNGLASKFIKRFVAEYKPKTIISFADRRWTLNVDNNLYTKLGFKLVGVIKPDYKYFNSKIAKNKRLHKFGFGKTSLKKKYPNLDFTKTEKQLTTELGFDRIWDCGLFKYELIF